MRSGATSSSAFGRPSAGALRPQRSAPIRRATRAGKSAVKAREQAGRRLVDALRRLIADGLSIRESAERVGVTYHAARSLIRAADVADAARDENVGGQI